MPCSRELGIVLPIPLPTSLFFSFSPLALGNPNEASFMSFVPARTTNAEKRMLIVRTQRSENGDAGSFDGETKQRLNKIRGAALRERNKGPS